MDKKKNNKRKIINLEILSKESGIQKYLIKYLFQLIIAELKKGNLIRVVNFGVFSIKGRNKHKSRNPKTGEDIVISKHKYPHFKFNNVIKDMFKRGKK